MSVYFVEKKGWRYDFMRKGERYTQAFFKTKREAEKEEQKAKNLLERPSLTDMAFLHLVELRLDEVKQRLSTKYYMETVYLAKKWVKYWDGLNCSEVTVQSITMFRDDRSKVSNETANKEIRYLRSLFNWGIRKGYITVNPASLVDMLRVDKRTVYVPTEDDIDKVFKVASLEQRDYLWCLRDTFARSKEINNLQWDDIDFINKTTTLYTRKKKHGTKTPRTIPMTNTLLEVLSKRYKNRNESNPWVFWHTYYSRRVKKKVDGPFIDRKKFMKTLCDKAGVKYFRFHPLRHAGASYMESMGIPISVIQEILGHENRKTTEHYIHSIGNSKIEAFEILQKTRRPMV